MDPFWVALPQSSVFVAVQMKKKYMKTTPMSIAVLHLASPQASPMLVGSFVAVADGCCVVIVSEAEAADSELVELESSLPSSSSL